jgi:hypothetical protein
MKCLRINDFVCVLKTQSSVKYKMSFMFIFKRMYGAANVCGLSVDILSMHLVPTFRQIYFSLLPLPLPCIMNRCA